MKTLFLSIVLLATLSVSAQKDNGFYGNKFFIEADLLMNNPLCYNLFDNPYENPALKKVGSSLGVGKDQFNIGYRINAGYALKRNLALGIEIGQDFSSFYPEKYAYLYDSWNSAYGYEIEHEMVDITTMNIIPKIEIANSMALLPMGLSHSIGFGVALTKMVEKNYTYRAQDIYNYNMWTMGTYQNSQTDPIEISKYPALRKYVILYAINMRTPLTKNLLLSYGLKYTINFGGLKNYVYPGVNQAYQAQDVIFEMNRQRKLSFINLNLGLAYSF